MALSGMLETKFYTVSGVSRFAFRLYWSAVQNIEKNTSEITVTAKLAGLISTSQIISGHSASVTSIRAGGSEYKATNNISINGITEKTLYTIKHVVTHAANGTGSFTLGGSQTINITFPNAFISSVSISNRSIVLDQIPRASTFTSLSDFVVGGNPACTIRRKSTAFTHTVTVKIGMTTIRTLTGQGDLNSIPLSGYVSALLSAIPGGSSATLTVTMQTYHGVTAIGSAVTRTCRVTVPTSYAPSISSTTEAETDQYVSLTVGRYVQNQSRVRLRIVSATAGQGAAIDRYEIIFQGQTYVSNDAIVDVTRSGTISIRYRVRDSRGRWAEASSSISVLTWRPPTISTFIVKRANSAGVVNPLGTYARTQVYTSANSLMNGTQKNTLTARLYHRTAGSSGAYTLARTLTAETGSLVSISSILSGLSGFGVKVAYEWKLDVTDLFTTVTSSTTLSTGEALMVLGKDGIGIGKFPVAGRKLDMDDGFWLGGKNVLNQLNTMQTNIGLLQAKTRIKTISTQLHLYDLFVGLENGEELLVYLYIASKDNGWPVDGEGQNTCRISKAATNYGQLIASVGTRMYLGLKGASSIRWFRPDGTYV